MTGSPFKRIGVSALAVAALSLTACGSAASSGAAAAARSGSGTPSQTLTIGYDSDPAPQGYDPLLYAGGQRLFYESLYQSLFVQTASGGVAPGLVASYSYNAKKTQLTLKLKSGVTFTDGSKLTAQLVKENLDRRSNAKLQSYGAFAKGGAEEITSVTAPDASTVVLTFAAPQATFQTKLAGEPGMIVGQQGHQQPGQPADHPRRLRPVHAGVGRHGQQLHGDPQGRRRRRDLPVHDDRLQAVPRQAARVNAQISGQTDVSVLDATTAATAQSNGVSLAKNGGTIQTLLIFDKTGVSRQGVRQQAGAARAQLRHRPRGVRGRPRQGQPPDGERVPAGLARLRPGARRPPTPSATPRPSSCSPRPGYPNGFSFTITSSPDRRGAA